MERWGKSFLWGRNFKTFKRGRNFETFKRAKCEKIRHRSPSFIHLIDENCTWRFLSIIPHFQNWLAGLRQTCWSEYFVPASFLSLTFCFRQNWKHIKTCKKDLALKKSCLLHCIGGLTFYPVQEKMNFIGTWCRRHILVGTKRKIKKKSLFPKKSNWEERVDNWIKMIGTRKEKTNGMTGNIITNFD